MKLPRVPGREVLREIKSTELLKRIPVVVLSSSAQSKDINRVYDLGVNSYLVKPVKFSTFCDMAAEIKMYRLLFNEKTDPE